MNSLGVNSRCMSRTRAGSRASVETPKPTRPSSTMAKLGPQPCTNISAELSVNVTVVRIFGLYLDTHQLMGSVRKRFPRNAAEP